VQRYLGAGVQFVIIGTKAVNAPHFLRDLCIEFPNHVMVSLDAKDGRLALNGWSKLTHHDAIEMAVHCERDGVASIVYTDIGRDGMMGGFNHEATSKLANAVTTPVFASGGVSTLDDIRKLKEIEHTGVAGAVIGRALYENSFTLAEANKIANP